MYINVSKKVKYNTDETVNFNEVTDNDVLILDDDESPFSINRQEAAMYADARNSDTIMPLIKVLEARGYEHMSTIFGVWVLRNNECKLINFN